MGAYSYCPNCSSLRGPSTLKEAFEGESRCPSCEASVESADSFPEALSMFQQEFDDTKEKTKDLEKMKELINEIKNKLEKIEKLTGKIKAGLI